MNIGNVLDNNNENDNILDPNVSILDPKNQHLDPKEKRQFFLNNESVLKSKHNIKDFPDDKFTNFISKNIKPTFINDVYDYAKDWNKLENQVIDDDIEGTERLKRIFNLYLESEWTFSQIAKCKIRTSELDDSTGLRVFFIIQDRSYNIFLIDPLHLVIPSKWQRKNNTFENNKSNGLCMSKAFEEIKDMI